MLSTQISDAIPIEANATTRTVASSALNRILIFGAVSIIVGVLWDISWHRTIGRDTFWTPAHLAIYLGGLLGGFIGGWLILSTTFLASHEERAASVGVWGFRGPMGAWVSVWGSLAMLTSAPFDNWWHDAYGLDVRILSPPHTVLALGMWAVVLGALLLVLRDQNNAVNPAANQWLFLFASGIILSMGSVFLLEYSFPNQHHSNPFYRVSCMTYPLYLVGMARAAKSRCAATWIALFYMLIMASMVWILPLFPGEPRLGPIYHHVDHFVPQPFPLLLVVPALAIDLVRWGMERRRGWLWDWVLALACATAFLALFLVTQWFFSKFLLSHAAENWFFGGDRHWGYTENLGPWRKQFWSEMNPKGNPPLTRRGVEWAFLCAFISARAGLFLGNWMTKVRR